MAFQRNKNNWCTLSRRGPCVTLYIQRFRLSSKRSTNHIYDLDVHCEIPETNKNAFVFCLFVCLFSCFSSSFQLHLFSTKQAHTLISRCRALHQWRWGGGGGRGERNSQAQIKIFMIGSVAIALRPMRRMPR